MFEFRRLGESEPVTEEGSCRVYGELLKQLKALEHGQVLQLTGQDGKVYGIVNWDDLRRAEPQEPPHG